MLQPGGEANLAEKAVGTQACGDLRVQHLEGDRPIVLEVLHQIDRGHAPAAELALDAVAVGQRGRQLAHSVSRQENPARARSL